MRWAISCFIFQLKSGPFFTGVNWSRLVSPLLVLGWMIVVHFMLTSITLLFHAFFAACFLTKASRREDVTPILYSLHRVRFILESVSRFYRLFFRPWLAWLTDWGILPSVALTRYCSLWISLFQETQSQGTNSGVIMFFSCCPDTLVQVVPWHSHYLGWSSNLKAHLWRMAFNTLQRCDIFPRL